MMCNKWLVIKQNHINVKSCYEVGLSKVCCEQAEYLNIRAKYSQKMVADINMYFEYIERIFNGNVKLLKNVMNMLYTLKL